MGKKPYAASWWSFQHDESNKRELEKKQQRNLGTYSHTSKTTCCKRSGNFCTIVTGWPDVKLTPYIGAVVLYRVLQRRAGVALHFSIGFNERAAKKEKNHRKRSINNFRWIFCWSIRNSEETMYKKDEKKNQIKRQKKNTSHSDTKCGTISKMQIVSLPIPCHYITFSIESRACNFTAPFICVCFEHQWTWTPWYCEYLRPCHHHTIHS